MLSIEVAYETIETWITLFLLGNNKKLWPKFPLNIGRYSLSNGPHARNEFESLQEICLCIGEPKGNDPQDIVINHVKVVGLTHPIIHQVNHEKKIVKGVLFFEDVLNRFPNEPTK